MSEDLSLTGSKFELKGYRVPAMVGGTLEGSSRRPYRAARR